MGKGKKDYLLVFASVFSLYLLLLLPVSGAMQVSGYLGNAEEKKVSFSPLDSSVSLENDSSFNSIKCGETSKKPLVFVFEYPKSGSFDIDITANAATSISGFDSDITSLLECSPTTGLVNNQKVICRFDQKAFLERFSDCPPQHPLVLLTFFFTMKTSSGDIPLTITKPISIIGRSDKAEIEIQSSPYSYPEVNCLLGSKVKALVKVKHAETITKGIFWSYSVNNSKRYSNIECSIASEGDINTGSKDDIYNCVITVPSLAFDKCISGQKFPINITAKIDDYSPIDGFYATTVKEDLDIKLSVNPIGSVECQVVSFENGVGDCVPKNPQRNLRVKITGNRIKDVDTFAYKFGIDDGNMTSMSCELISATNSEQRYDCKLFLPRKLIPEEPEGSESFLSSSLINISFQTRYVNTFGSASGSTTAYYKGEYRSPDMNILKKLEEKKEELKTYQNILKKLKTAIEFTGWVIGCCGISGAVEKINKDGIIKYLKSYMTDRLEKSFGSFMKGVETLIVDVTPAAMDCIAESMAAGYDKNIQKLKDFESGDNSYTPLNEDFSLTKILSSLDFLKCSGSKIFKNIAGGCLNVLVSFFKPPPDWREIIKCASCIGAVFVLGIAGKPDYCANVQLRNTDMNIIRCINPTDAAYSLTPLETILVCTNKLLKAASVIVGLLSYLSNKEMLEPQAKHTNARMKIEMQNQASVAECPAAYAEFVSDLATESAINTALGDLFPQPPESYISIKDSTGNLISSGDELCGYDQITIEYNLEKFESLKDFRGEMKVKYQDADPPRNIINLDASGEISIKLNDLLQIQTVPEANRNGEYSFIFSYSGKEKIMTINYQETC